MTRDGDMSSNFIHVFHISPEIERLKRVLDIDLSRWRKS